MFITKPYFMENSEWWYLDEENELWKLYEMQCYRLTDKAPKEAVESYLQYCTEVYNYSIGRVPKFVYEEYHKHL